MVVVNRWWWLTERGGFEIIKKKTENKVSMIHVLKYSKKYSTWQMEHWSAKEEEKKQETLAVMT